MAVRRRTGSTARGNAAPRKAAPAAKRAPAKAANKPAGKDVTVYADKEPTDYHKAFANWIVKEVGYDPNSASSKRAAFLMGVSIGTAGRPAFMESDYLAEWRERTGVNKRGPKRTEEAEEETPVAATRGRNTAKTRKVAEPEPDEFDDEDEEIDDDDEFDEDDESDDDEFGDDDEDDDDDDDEDDFEEPAPKSSRSAASRSRVGSASTAGKTATRGNTSGRTTRTATRSKKSDEDYVF